MSELPRDPPAPRLYSRDNGIVGLWYLNQNLFELSISLGARKPAGRVDKQEGNKDVPEGSSVS